jgi:cytochrome oxidase Cu insertion factor (SCO1/SenC/PrrC family)
VRRTVSTRILTAAAALVCVVVATLAAHGGPATQTVPAAAAHRAPDFHLPLLGGGTISLANFKGKPLVLLFWAPW